MLFHVGENAHAVNRPLILSSDSPFRVQSAQSDLEGVSCQIADGASERTEHELTVTVDCSQLSPGPHFGSLSVVVEEGGRMSKAAAVAAVLVTFATLLAAGASRHTPTIDEVAHLPSGLCHWQLVKFTPFRVNPPLVRMIASLPVLAVGFEPDWSGVESLARPEFLMGQNFLGANGPRSLYLYKLASWSLIPFAMLGGLVCFLWARSLYGWPAGMTALVLWCFNPSVLGFGWTILPDLSAATIGILASYVFWLWLRRPGWLNSVALGVVTGLAMLTKFTWVILVPLWPALWIATLRPLGEFQFRSQLLSGRVQTDLDRVATANRFARTPLAVLPVPVPADYLIGIDLQQFHLDVDTLSYLRGSWQYGGWWYYHLYGIFVKTPLGVLILLCLAIASNLSGRGDSGRSAIDAVLLTVPVILVLLVSAHTSSSRHVRYVLPAMPFLFVFAASTMRSPLRLRRGEVALAVSLVGWAVMSSLAVYPYSISYFNELAGGPEGGHAHLIDSNIDIGQDLQSLRTWLENHSEARPLKLA
ncbi:hypothetical protein HK102_009968, partial [Quaeritorhiza haematococci]